MNRRNLLAAGASALAGFFIGGKPPQLAASEDITTLADEREYVAYTIPNCGKIPEGIIFGDAITTPLTLSFEWLKRFDYVLRQAGSKNKIVAQNAGRKIGWLVNDTCRNMVINGLKKRFVTLPANEDNYTTDKLVQQSVDIGLEYMHDQRYDVIIHAFQSLVDGIIERCNDDPHQYVDPLYISFYYDGYDIAHAKELFTLRGRVWLVNFPYAPYNPPKVYMPGNNPMIDGV